MRGDANLVSFLKESTEMLYNLPHDGNPGEDKTGTDVETVNKGRAVWLLVGYFNTLTKPPKIDDTPKIQRTIHVRPGSRIFCMVGSAHATKFDVTRGMTVTPEFLSQTANLIQKLWTVVKLTIDGVPQKLEEVETDMFDVVIPGKDAAGNDHPYVSYYKHLGVTPGPTPIVSVALVYLFTYDGLPHTVDFYASAAGNGGLGEIEYEVSVRYIVLPEESKK